MTLTSYDLSRTQVRKLADLIQAHVDRHGSVSKASSELGASRSVLIDVLKRPAALQMTARAMTKLCAALDVAPEAVIGGAF